jgi:hypothetical protein
LVVSVPLRRQEDSGRLRRQEGLEDSGHPAGLQPVASVASERPQVRRPAGSAALVPSLRQQGLADSGLLRQPEVLVDSVHLPELRPADSAALVRSPRQEGLADLVHRQEQASVVSAQSLRPAASAASAHRLQVEPLVWECSNRWQQRQAWVWVW